MLDGRDDVHSGMGSEFNDRRFVSSEEAQIVVRAKVEICDLLQSFFDMRVDKRISLFVKMYEDLFTKAFMAGGTMPDTREQTQWDLLNDLEQWNTHVWGPDDFVLLEKDMFKTPIIGKVVSASVGDPVENPAFVMEVMLDTMRYDDSLLSSKAFLLLNRHMSQRTAFVKAISNAQILAYPEVIKVFLQAEKETSELRREIKWLLSDDHQRQAQAFEHCNTTVKSLTSLCTLGAEIDVPGSERLRVHEGNIIKFQTILRNLNVLDDVIRIVSLPLAKKSDGSESEHAQLIHEKLAGLFNKCFYFLKMWCTNVAENQLMLFPHLESFISLMGLEGINVADLICSILLNNKQLLNQLDTKFVHVAFKVIAQHGQKARWLRLPDTLLTCSDQPIKRNQNLVIKGMMLAKNDIMVLFNEIEARNTRLEMMCDDELSKNAAESKLM